MYNENNAFVCLRFRFYRASYASAVYTVIVSPSVHPSQVRVVQRLLNLGLHK